MLTSAGSQRALARELGVSHQQVGRWLREGEPLHIGPDGEMPTNKDGSLKVYGGAPEWIESQLNWNFDRHRDVTKAQALADGVPYNATVPVYTERRYLQNHKTISPWYNSRKTLVKKLVDKYGPEWALNHQIEFSEKWGYRIREVGDRVISGPTEFIREDMRRKWVAGMVASQAFYKVNVRSIIDLKHYFEKVAEDDVETRKRRGISKRKLAKEIMLGFRAREHAQRGRIIDQTEPFPLYTKSQDARPGANPWQTADNVEDLLQEKHSTATGFPGTKFADEYLLQLLPASYDRDNRKPAGRSRAASKRAATHPNRRKSR